MLTMEFVDKQSNCGNNTHDLLDKDAFQLGNVFPIEIWEIITNKVNRREHLNNSSPFFQKILAPQKPLFLFQSVMSLLISNLWTNVDQNALPLKDFRNCRQVCKIWNVAIDKLTYDSCHIFEGANNIKEIIQKEMSYNFYYDAGFDRHNLYSFLEHFRLTHSGQLPTRNPFVNPKLSVSTPDSNEYNDEREGELQEFTEQISTLLQSYGVYVIDFTLDIDDHMIDLEYVTRLQEWLICMPNLKRLSIVDRSEYQDDELPALQEYLVETPFSCFKYLECLEIRRLKAPLFNNLVQKNNHVSILHAKEGEHKYDFFSFPLPNLKALKIKLSTDTLDIVDKLSSPYVEWPLSSLTISFGIAHPFINWSELFQVIKEKFAERLVRLTLKLPMACGERGHTPWWDLETPLELHLPNLREIYLSTHTAVNLDFLLPTKDNLRTIFVRARYILPEGEGETKKSVVQFYGFEARNKILDSNIWTVFTKLEKIGIRIGCGLITRFNRENVKLLEKQRKSFEDFLSHLESNK